MRFDFAFGMTTAVAMLMASVSAFAQPAPFSCPKPGTVETRGNLTTKYAGTGQDPYVCRGIGIEGKPIARLFNFYPPMEAKIPGVRDSMLALISGRQTTAKVTYESGSTDTWTFLRREPLVIGGKSFNTMVFGFDRQRFASSSRPFHGLYTRWLDPVSGLWLKATLDKVDGQIGGEYPAYVDTAIEP